MVSSIIAWLDFGLYVPGCYKNKLNKLKEGQCGVDSLDSLGSYRDRVKGGNPKKRLQIGGLPSGQTWHAGKYTKTSSVIFLLKPPYF